VHGVVVEAHYQSGALEVMTDPGESHAIPGTEHVVRAAWSIEFFAGV
jgi:hypothetical protein